MNPTARARLRRAGWGVESPLWPAALIAGAYALSGLAMLAQPDRYIQTRPYAALAEIFTIPHWGVLYIVVAALFAVYIATGYAAAPAMVAHTAGFALTAFWVVAFFVRWRTDPLTTASNTIAWLVFLAIIIRSMLLIPLTIRRATP